MIVGTPYFDVAICGGGLAGLCLARQLQLEQPERSIVVIDQEARPLPEAAWKVGESTVEFAAHYLTEYLQLGEYLREKHLNKLGLRFIFPSQGEMSSRPEVGLSKFPPIPTFQLDRGILENDLREIVETSGATLREGSLVRSIDIAAAGGNHTVEFADVNGTSSNTLMCRWVVDASGRRQLIQRKLQLRLSPEGNACSAAWFRVRGRCDVDDLVPVSNSQWHDRVPGRIRYFSTTHLTGRGYWVWLIALSGNATSVGIVARNDMHPFEEYNTLDRARTWLGQHEPALAAHLSGESPLDFRALKSYSYSSRQVISRDRWACVGESGLFSDPFYSPGSDIIAIGNTMTCDLVARDFAGDAFGDRADHYSAHLIAINNRLTNAIQHGYKYLGDEVVSLGRGLWDYTVAWGHLCLQIFNRAFTDDEMQAAMRNPDLLPLALLAEVSRRLLDEWLALREAGQGTLTFDFVDYLTIEWLAEHRKANLRSHEGVGGFAAQYRANLRLFEALVQALFLTAVDDLFPGESGRFGLGPRLNIRALRLNPNSWDDDGLVQPSTERGDYLGIYKAIRSKLRRRDGSMQELSAVR